MLGGLRRPQDRQPHSDKQFKEKYQTYFLHTANRLREVNLLRAREVDGKRI